MLYTSRFGNKELNTGKYTVVGVVRSMPKFPVKYEIAGNIIQIAPPGYLWTENNRERFTKPYFEHLERSGYKMIRQILQKYLDIGKDVVLCCYEDVRKPNEWCHRLVFAEWWEIKTGEKIEELQDPSIITSSKPNTKKPESKQLSIFEMLNIDIDRR